MTHAPHTKTRTVLFLSDINPNLALMKLARHEVNENNKVFLKHSSPDKIYCSWIFKNNVNGQSYIDTFNNTKIIEGGFYVDSKRKLPPHIEHLKPYYKLYEKKHTMPRMGYTSRGCNNKCPWCIVWRKEGRLKDHAPISEFWDGKDQRLILLDNDFLNSPNFFDNAEFIINNKIKVNFHQGLNIRGITDDMLELLSKINYYTYSFNSRGLYFAYDDIKDGKAVLEGLMKTLNYIPKHHINFYCIGGFPKGDEFGNIYQRCFELIELGIRPYIMPYEKANKKIRQLKRCVSLGTWRKRGLDRAWKEYKA